MFFDREVVTAAVLVGLGLMPHSLRLGYVFGESHARLAVLGHTVSHETSAVSKK